MIHPSMNNKQSDQGSQAGAGAILPRAAKVRAAATCFTVLLRSLRVDHFVSDHGDVVYYHTTRSN